MKIIFSQAFLSDASREDVTITLSKYFLGKTVIDTWYNGRDEITSKQAVEEFRENQRTSDMEVEGLWESDTKILRLHLQISELEAYNINNAVMEYNIGFFYYTLPTNDKEENIAFVLVPENVKSDDKRIGIGSFDSLNLILGSNMINFPSTSFIKSKLKCYKENTDLTFLEGHGVFRGVDIWTKPTSTNSMVYIDSVKDYIISGKEEEFAGTDLYITREGTINKDKSYTVINTVDFINITNSPESLQVSHWGGDIVKLEGIWGWSSWKIEKGNWKKIGNGISTLDQIPYGEFIYTDTDKMLEKVDWYNKTFEINPCPISKDFRQVGIRIQCLRPTSTGIEKIVSNEIIIYQDNSVSIWEVEYPSEEIRDEKHYFEVIRPESQTIFLRTNKDFKTIENRGDEPEIGNWFRFDYASDPYKYLKIDFTKINHDDVWWELYIKFSTDYPPIPLPWESIPEPEIPDPEPPLPQPKPAPPKPDQETGVAISQTEATLDIGQTLQLTATFADPKVIEFGGDNNFEYNGEDEGLEPEEPTEKTPGDGFGVEVLIYSWYSSNESVATVDRTGFVTAIGKGTAEIYVETFSKKRATCHVTVKPPVTRGIVLNTRSKTMMVGDTLQLTPTITPSIAEPTLTWSTSDSEVATVSRNGLVTAIGRGRVKITVTSENGKSDSCWLVIRTPDPVPLDYSMDMAGGEYQQFTVLPVFPRPEDYSPVSLNTIVIDKGELGLSFSDLLEVTDMELGPEVQEAEVYVHSSLFSDVTLSLEIINPTEDIDLVFIHSNSHNLTIPFNIMVQREWKNVGIKVVTEKNEKEIQENIIGKITAISEKEEKEIYLTIASGKIKKTTTKLKISAPKSLSLPNPPTIHFHSSGLCWEGWNEGGIGTIIAQSVNLGRVKSNTLSLRKWDGKGWDSIKEFGCIRQKDGSYQLLARLPENNSANEIVSTLSLWDWTTDKEVWSAKFVQGSIHLDITPRTLTLTGPKNSLFPFKSIFNIIRTENEPIYVNGNWEINRTEPEIILEDVEWGEGSEKLEEKGRHIKLISQTELLPIFNVNPKFYSEEFNINVKLKIRLKFNTEDKSVYGIGKEDSDPIFLDLWIKKPK